MQNTVRLVFTNLLFVIGVVLLITGASRGVLTLAKLIIFDKYPLDSYMETRCQVPQEQSQYGEVLPRLDAQCATGLEYERKIKLTEDTINSITMLISGIILTVSFKKFIFNDIIKNPTNSKHKKSKE